MNCVRKMLSYFLDETDHALCAIVGFEVPCIPRCETKTGALLDTERNPLSLIRSQICEAICMREGSKNKERERDDDHLYITFSLPETLVLLFLSFS